MAKKQKALLKDVVKHVDITKIDATAIVDAMRGMSFSSRDTARAADILQMMIKNRDCSNWLILAGSTSAGGCMQVYADMVRYRMVDCVVATGASIIDMDLFEALGYKHYKGTPFVDDAMLRKNYIDRIYDTYIDEDELQACDAAVREIADTLESRPYSSREFIWKIGEWLTKRSKKKNSLIQTCYECGVPIFVPAFSDCSAGFGMVMHQIERIKQGKPYMTLDSVADFRELTQIKLRAKTTGLFMVGGGVPKNFAQDTVVCAEILGYDVPMHQYAVQITVADSRDGACSSSTLKEASSWGKVQTIHEQMVYAEATTVVPLIASYAYHQGDWAKRKAFSWTNLFAKKTSSKTPSKARTSSKKKK
ncbi:MAG: deoxyhypusine synthase [Prevotellaceae bacterium]|jgi:deoxyhypusine synthase|nr:deoxyhypusine synthase [Prevotellaceae bacterium]